MTTTAEGAKMRTHKMEGDVKWVETDASGRIHNTAALRWAEAAEHSFYQDVAPSLSARRLPRRKIEVTFHRPLAFRDPYTVNLTVKSLGRTSVTYSWEITSSGQVCIEGNHVVVYVDEAGSPSPWPEHFRALAGGESDVP